MAGVVAGLALLAAAVYVAAPTLLDPGDSLTAAQTVAPPTARPSIAASGPLGMVGTSTPVPPVDLAALQATAEERFTRTPGAVGPRPPTQAPPTRPPELPEKPAAPSLQPTEAPSATPAPPPSVMPSPIPSDTPTPGPTNTPSISPTPTRTGTATPTATATATATPLPAPCTGNFTVPRVVVGNGYHTTFVHDGSGPIDLSWNVSGGRILVYEGLPSVFEGEASGITLGVPVVQPIAQAVSGPGQLHIPDRPPGEYTAFFYNASPAPVGPSEATITHLKFGGCT